jgi:hypothetical protein
MSEQDIDGGTAAMKEVRPRVLTPALPDNR